MRTADLFKTNRIFNGRECPACGERGQHQDNAMRPGTPTEKRSYCCNACGEHWDAIDYKLTDDEMADLVMCAV